MGRGGFTVLALGYMIYGLFRRRRASLAAAGDPGTSTQ